MNILDVKNVRIINGVEHATLELSVGVLWWKKIVFAEVCRPNFHWIFCDTGKFIPGYFVDDAVRAKSAKTRLKSEEKPLY